MKTLIFFSRRCAHKENPVKNNNINSILRILFLQALDISGVNTLFRRMHRNKALIIWYHGICDEDFDLLKGYDERHVSKELFRKQLKYLKSRGYVFISMTDLTNAIEHKKKMNKFVVLTFDDGFKNVVENAYPIMKDFGAKGCFYLVSDLIGTNELLWTDFIETVVRNQKSDNFQFIFKGETINYKLSDKKSYEYAMKDIKTKLRALPDKNRVEHLKQFANHKLYNVPKEFMMATWEQIKGLDPNILEIGGHTGSHPNCANLTTESELEYEIYKSKNDIERNTGRKIEHFCYPAGSYNDVVISKVKKYGYKSAVTIENGFNDKKSDLFKLKRIEANEQFPFFKASVSGSIDMLCRIKNIFC
jgi:peptidoglycan/xylan/chitin deacetylase (PgdA/CDA1 family)